MHDSTPETHQTPAPRWQALSARDRRVVGVLVEKAKTTPEAYPLSTSALKSGCNQKNNRFPLMELEVGDIEESLERLRGLGAVVEVQGGGRVARFRHCLYEWLGVDKVELAVMAELLLRGTQTEGELRGRAARMEPIADLAALRPVLASLKQKGLVISLSPEGRGHVVTHGLYEPRELEKQRAEVAAGGTTRHEAASAPHATYGEPNADGAQAQSSAMAELRREMNDLRDDVAGLRSELEALRAELCS
jgi:uncharacterized protein YceH (UPF0502 family)